MGMYLEYIIPRLIFKLVCSLIFNSSTDINVQARATSIRSGIPNAIYRLAEQSPGGLDLAFQDTTAFVNYTEQVYVRYFHWPSSYRIS